MKYEHRRKHGCPRPSVEQQGSRISVGANSHHASCLKRRTRFGVPDDTCSRRARPPKERGSHELVCQIAFRAIAVAPKYRSPDPNPIEHGKTRESETHHSFGSMLAVDPGAKKRRKKKLPTMPRLRIRKRIAQLCTGTDNIIDPIDQFTGDFLFEFPISARSIARTAFLRQASTDLYSVSLSVQIRRDRISSGSSRTTARRTFLVDHLQSSPSIVLPYGFFDRFFATHCDYLNLDFGSGRASGIWMNASLTIAAGSATRARLVWRSGSR